MLFNENFTLFHFESDDSLNKYVFKKCYAHTKSGVQLTKDASKSEMTNVLILYQDNIEKIKPGDLIVLEEVSGNYELERDLRSFYKVYIVQSIQDCKQGNIRHYELICK